MLYENRNVAANEVKTIMENPAITKAMCGCTGDVNRLKKDWGIFPVNVVDVQHLFNVWKEDSLEDCLQTCFQALQQRRGRELTLEEARQYLEHYSLAGLDFLYKVFHPHEENAGKHKLATWGDWRTRPLHRELVIYAAKDAYMTLDVYFRLCERVSCTL